MPLLSPSRMPLAVPPAPTCLRFGPAHVLDLLAHTLHVDGLRVKLTRREFELLSFLVQHPLQAFSRDELIHAVWGGAFDGYPHTVSAHVNRLRSKIEIDPAHPQLIATVWGLGYRFESPGRHNAGA